MTRSALVVLVMLLAAGPAWGARATPHLDALEATLADRAAALAGATDKTAKKQLRAAEKSLARIAVDTVSLAEDLKLAKKIAGPVAKAYATDDEVMALLSAAADAFEGAVEAGADVLARARAPLPEAKLTKKADRLLRKAEKARAKARTQRKFKKRLSLLYKAQRSADKAADVLAAALGDPVPTRLVLSPESALLTAPGEAVTLRAVVLDQLARPMQAQVAFVSTEPNVASVTIAGVVTGGAVGSAQILATTGDLETSVPIISARPAPGAIPVPDNAVVGPLLPVDPDSFGMGAEYTAILRGDPPVVGDLLYGTGELPLGGEVVAVEPAGDDWLVTLAIVPLDVLFADLEIHESLPVPLDDSAVPAEIAEQFDVEQREDGTWVFTGREDAEALERRRPRGTAVGTFQQDLCESSVAFPLAFSGGIRLEILVVSALGPYPELELEYSDSTGLERLVAKGTLTATVSYSPRLQAAISGSLECKVELLKPQLRLPGVLALVFGAQFPLGVGFKIEGSIQAAAFGFDLSARTQTTLEAGIACNGLCETVENATSEGAGDPASQNPFRFITPNPSEQFTVSAALRAFGYFDMCLGNPIFDALQLCMLEVRAGLEQTLTWSPTLVQLNNETSASEYHLALYTTIGAKAELMGILEFFNLNLVSFQLRSELELARSPQGSFEFEGPVSLGDTVRATVQLQNVTYLTAQNVSEVRFYRKDDGTLLDKASVPRATPGQTTYVGEWDANAFDLGADFYAVVTTWIPFLEFEIEPDSKKTLEEQEEEQEFTHAIVFGGSYSTSAVVLDSENQIIEEARDSGSILSPGLISSPQSTSLASANLDARVEVESVGINTRGLRFEACSLSTGSQAGGLEGLGQTTLSFEFDVFAIAPVPYTLSLATDLTGQSGGASAELDVVRENGSTEDLACVTSPPSPACPQASSEVSGVLEHGGHYTVTVTTGAFPGTATAEATLVIGESIGSGISCNF